MDYNYHTHTFRCAHATGREEAYINYAIDNGIKHMGFSDHIPYRFPDGYESGYRVPVELGKNYVDTISRLRDKYKDSIDISIGFEMEYYPLYFEDMLSVARNLGAEYLILGQHFIHNEHPDGKYIGNDGHNQEDFRDYVNCILDGIKTGVFTYVAHPDAFEYPTGRLYEENAEKICRASLEYDTPLETNFLGIREGRSYPRESFWHIAGKVGCPVTFGFDSHSTRGAYDGESLKAAMSMVKQYKLNYIGRPRLVSIK